MDETPSDPEPKPSTPPLRERLKARLAKLRSRWIVLRSMLPASGWGLIALLLLIVGLLVWGIASWLPTSVAPLVGTVLGWFLGLLSTPVVEYVKGRRETQQIARVHPTMKPVELFAALLRNSCRMGGRVLDPFGGSGTSLLAAEQTGRSASLVELDPRYCDVIVRRFEQVTGKTAERVPKWV